MTRLVWFIVLAAGLGCAFADVITIGGAITQSTQQGSNNLSLNNIQDGDSYTAVLDFSALGTSAITAPGVYDLTGASLIFSDPAALAMETSFGSITLVVTNAGPVDDVTLIGCLTTGTACNQGNSLSASFEIPTASLNAPNVAATGLDQPHPLDLLEDDGVTDIQGQIATYSYNSTVPEPRSAFLLSGALTVMWVVATKKRSRS
jgi:hypothetical protein